MTHDDDRARYEARAERLPVDARTAEDGPIAWMHLWDALYAALRRRREREQERRI